MNPNDLMIVERCYDMTQAHIMRGLLESNDIPCFLMDEHHNAVAWHLGPALGGTRIMVMQKDYETARTLLNESQNSAAQEESTPKDFLRKPYIRNIILGLFGLFSGAPLVWPKGKSE